MRALWTIGFAEGQTIIEEIVAAAVVENSPVSAAVVDAAGALVCFARMDGAPTFSAGLAQSKAVSSVTFGRATSDFESAIRDRPVFAIGLLQHGSWYAGRGGAPIVVDGQVVGAVGVSGNTGEREDELAKEAAARAAVAIGAGDIEGNRRR
jgi:glc operon protein GlcG